jgi:beta-N-acetylhexosaminidase
MKPYTLRQKVASLCIFGFEGTVPSDPGCIKIKNQIKNLKLGGIILYARNIVSPEQTKVLNAFFHEGTEDAPVFVSVDQEGGKVQRLVPSKGFVGGPSAGDIREMSLADAYAAYSKMALDIKENGFNFNFAPVVDLHLTDAEGSVIGPFHRSYGKDPVQVVEYAEQWLKALKDHNILNSIKHFPGHGSAEKDSHAGFVDVTHTWTPAELEPFYVLTKKHEVDTVMTAHIYNKNLDADHPATFSAGTLDLLRQQGYEGVIISDDLHMGAVLEGYKIHKFADMGNLRHVIVDSFKAGNDMVIFSQYSWAAKTITDFQVDLELPEKIANWVAEAVENGQLSADRIEEAFQRVMGLKRKLAKG